MLDFIAKVLSIAAYVVGAFVTAIVMAAIIVVFKAKFDRAHSPEDSFRRDRALQWLQMVALILIIMVAAASVLAHA